MAALLTLSLKIITCSKCGREDRDDCVSEPGLLMSLSSPPPPLPPRPNFLFYFIMDTVAFAVYPTRIKSIGQLFTVMAKFFSSASCSSTVPLARIHFFKTWVFFSHQKAMKRDSHGSACSGLRSRSDPIRTFSLPLTRWAAFVDKVDPWRSSSNNALR